MSRETERVLITNKFLEVWPINDWPVKMENINLPEPANGQFAHFILVPGEDLRLSLGQDHMMRHHSYLQIDCYVKLDSGTAQYNPLEETLRNQFDDRQFQTTDNQVITFSKLRVRNFGPYFQKNRRSFIMEFHRDAHVNRS